MGIASTVREYLDEAGVDYELIHHSYSPNSRKAADAAHVSPDNLAKPVMLEDERGYLMAVVPASRRVELASLERQLGRRLVLATERELQDLFSDCSKGAVPAVGQAYGVEVIWDDCLASCTDVYFEAGDHTDLVRMTGKEFTFLMSRRAHGRISRPEVQAH
jgi:Ala-tRNA(Pro) deacylase